MKRTFTLSLALVTAACSAHLPAPTNSAVSTGYQELADANRSAATLTVETAQPVGLLATATRADVVDCVGSTDRIEYDQVLAQSVNANEATMIAHYTSLHLIPNEVTVEGDRIHTPTDEAFVRVYTDDGHQGSICSFELDKLRVVASQ